jgi:hypothetical protein
MNSMSTFGWIEQIAGAVIMLLVLTDVFMTVLYARIGTGLLSDRIAAGAWKTFKTVSKLFAAQSGAALSFCGPTIVVLILFVWSFGLTLGAALIIHPHLGRAIRANSGPTPHDFATAMYAAAGSISILGGSEFTPKTAPFRLFFVFNSLVGLSTISLTLTYLMQVYSALRERNTLGLKFYLLSGETSDAAELLARLGSRGRFQPSSAIIAELAAEMTRIKESHHFYPVIFYFRFREPFYSISKTTELAFETCTLIKSGLSDEKYDWLKNGAAVLALERSTLMLVKLLEDVSSLAELHSLVSCLTNR